MSDPAAAASEVARRVGALQGVVSVLMDGSVSYGGYVAGYSDVDIKVIVSAVSVDEGLWLNVRGAIRAAASLCEAPINLWCVRDREFLAAYHASLPPFDFVRRHVVRRARVLCGRDLRAEVKCPDAVTLHEVRVCISQITTFAIRLRRLLTNPTAVSDVRCESGSLFAQQGISYYFHALRYFLAAAGIVAAPIASLVDGAARVDELPPLELARAQRLLELRAHWPDTDWERGSAGSEVLSESEAGLRSFADALQEYRRAFTGRTIQYD